MRISTTTLESFRLWSDPEQDWMPESELLASIRGEFTPTPPVLLGKAFGEVLERPWDFLVAGGFQHGCFRFDAASMAPALALMDHARGVFEAKGTKDYGRSTVVAKADQIVGAHLYEHKATLNPFNIEKYLDSYQWRYMADIFEPAVITYHIFLLAEQPDLSHSVRGVETFSVYPYAALHDDCAELVRRFEQFAEARGVADYLRERQRTAA